MVIYEQKILLNYNTNIFFESKHIFFLNPNIEKKTSVFKVDIKHI
jgi:hypothetical protein